MINLGDVNFSLGADTRDLQRSIQQLRQFGQVVNQSQNVATRGAQQTANALRKQEAATIAALNATQRLTQQMRKTQGGEQFARQAAAAYAQLNSELTHGQLSALHLQRAMERYKVSTNNATRGFKEFAQRQKAAADGTIGLSGAMRTLQSSTVLIQGPLGGLATRISNLTSLMNSTTAAFAAFVGGFTLGGVAIYQVGRQILDAGKQLNSFMGQFTAVTGSVGQSEQLMRRITSIARITGQRIEDLAPAFARFNIAAQGTGLTTKQVEEAFITLASAATKLQLNQEQSMGIFRALEQMMSKGTVQAEELRGQLGDRLAGAVQIAARAMGVTTRRLQEMMKAGEVITSGFLPKFIDQLAKTLNIDGKPIDNYTAAVNNMSTAWFQLRVELDRQFGVTEAVMNGYKALTNTIDAIRHNLEDIKIVALAVGGALLGMVAPAVISGFVALSRGIIALTFQMGILNKVMMANPLFRLAHIALIVGGAVAAIYEFRDSIRVVSGEVATLGDYFQVAMQEINQNMGSTAAQLQQSGQRWVDNIALSFKGLGVEWSITWMDIYETSIRTIDRILDLFYNLNDAIPAALKGIPYAFASIMVEAMNEMIAVIERGINYVMGVARDRATHIVSVFPSLGAIMPAFSDVSLEGFKNTYAGVWRDTEQEINTIMSRQNRILQGTIDKIEEYRKRANDIAMARIYSDPSRRQDIYKPPVPGFEIEPGGANAGEETETTRRQVRELERRKAAMDDINRAIGETRREVEALHGTEAEYQQAMQRLDRENEVLRYAEALRKAGVASQFIGEKTRELYELLEQRDIIERAREGMDAMRDSWAQGFDTMANSIVDAMLDGEDAMDSLRKTAKAVVQDILKTFLQLSLINPLKNMLFGLNEPTIAGPLDFFKKQAAQTFTSSFSGGSGWEGLRDISGAASNALPLIGQGIRGSRLENVVGNFSKSIDTWAASIRKIESGSFQGNYSALGQISPKTGDRAYGAYQVMGNNVGPWTKQHLGRAMSPSEFLRNPSAQDAVFKGQFSGYADKYGPSGAAQAWIGGPGSVGKMGRTDFLGTSVSKYTKMFEDNMRTLSSTTKNVAGSISQLGKAGEFSAEATGKVGQGMQQLGNALNQFPAAPGGGGGGGIGGLFKGLFGGGGLPSFSFMNNISPFATSTLLGGSWGGGLWAKGGAFRRGSPIKRFAKGDIFGSPTTFPMASGHTGMLGEAGEEAIMPLDRGPDGKLGVRNLGGSGSGDVSRILLELSPDLVATILSQAKNQSIEITGKGIKSFSKSEEFEARAAVAVKKKQGQRMG